MSLKDEKDGYQYAWRGTRWNAFVRAGKKKPMLVFNIRTTSGLVQFGELTQQVTPVTADHLSNLAAFIQDDFENIGAPGNATHWYCVFRGSDVRDFKVDHFYKIPLQTDFYNQNGNIGIDYTEIGKPVDLKSVDGYRNKLP